MDNGYHYSQRFLVNILCIYFSVLVILPINQLFTLSLRNIDMNIHFNDALNAIRVLRSDGINADETLELLFEIHKIIPHYDTKNAVSMSIIEANDWVYQELANKERIP